MLLTVTCSRVGSQSYSRVMASRNWRHLVVDLHLFVDGPASMLLSLKRILEGSAEDVCGLMVSEPIHTPCYSA